MKKIFAFVIAIMMFVIAGCQCTNNTPVEEAQAEEAVEAVDTTCNMQPVDTLEATHVDEVEE